MLREFLAKYDVFHNLEFNQIKYRPGAKNISGFGIDTSLFSKKSLRLHIGVDSTWSYQSGYNIYAPFDIIKAEFLENIDNYQSLLILHTEYGFQIRVAFIELNPQTIEAIKNSKPIKSGSLLGTCSSKGTNLGIHAHTEIVSNESNYTILDEILKEKFDESKINYNYSEKHIISYLNLAGIDISKGLEILNQEIQSLKIELLNNNKCIKIDYLTNQERIFYNSLALFGF